LVVSYEEAKRRNLPITPSLEAQFEYASFDEIKGTLPAYKPFTFNDLVTQTNDTSAAARTYGEAVAGVINKHAPQNAMHEYASVLVYLETQDATYLKDLDRIALSYKKMYDDLKLVSVPPSFNGEHVHLVNNVLAFYLLTDMMSKIQTDPLLAHAAIGEYPDYEEKLTKSYALINEELIKKGVNFGPLGIASLFTQIESN
jgi:hypothetical protein